MRADETIRYRNTLEGLAAGDAWGYQVEFVTHDQLGVYPVSPPQSRWIVSDDTQMTLALHQALGDVAGQLDDIPAVTAAITDRFIQWKHDPLNTRAPGATCMTSIGRLEAGTDWWQPDGARRSAGCGAVMRVAPAAFCPGPVWRGLSVLQALVTHNHPRAAVPALLLAGVIRDAHRLGGLMLDAALAEAVAIRSGDSAAGGDPFLAEVLSPITRDVPSYLVAGLDDGTEELLRAARNRLDTITPGQEHLDLCVDVGQGWESASAIALGMLAADMAAQWATPDLPWADIPAGRAALAWAATTNGDSDSIACIAGAVVGAGHDDPAWWASQGVRPHFEPIYDRQIHNAQPPSGPRRPRHDERPGGRLAHRLRRN